MYDQEFDTPGDALIHYGKKGMKWGVRNEKRLQRAVRVGSGTATRKERVAFSQVDTSSLSVIRNKSLEGAAQSRARELQGRKDRIQKGEATVKDFLALHGGDRLLITGKA